MTALPRRRMCSCVGVKHSETVSTLILQLSSHRFIGVFTMLLIHCRYFLSIFRSCFLSFFKKKKNRVCSRKVLSCRGGCKQGSVSRLTRQDSSAAVLKNNEAQSPALPRAACRHMIRADRAARSCFLMLRRRANDGARCVSALQANEL